MVNVRDGLSHGPVDSASQCHGKPYASYRKEHQECGPQALMAVGFQRDLEGLTLAFGAVVVLAFPKFGSVFVTGSAK